MQAVRYAGKLNAFVPLYISKAIEQVYRLETARNIMINGTGETLLGNPLLYRQSEATDLRDKIYALLGLSKDSGPDGLNVIISDYDLDVLEIYHSLAVSVLTRT